MNLRQINWKQPKYMLPAIIYIPLLATGYFVIDIFHTETAEVPSELETTEYLNAELPKAQLKGDAIVSKRDAMERSFGQISDFSAVEGIEQDDDQADDQPGLEQAQDGSQQLVHAAEQDDFQEGLDPFPDQIEEGGDHHHDQDEGDDLHHCGRSIGQVGGDPVADQSGETEREPGAEEKGEEGDHLGDQSLPETFDGGGDQADQQDDVKDIHALLNNSNEIRIFVS